MPNIFWNCTFKDGFSQMLFYSLLIRNIKQENYSCHFCLRSFLKSASWRRPTVVAWYNLTSWVSGQCRNLFSFFLTSDYMEEIHRSDDNVIITHIPEVPNLPTFSFKRKYGLSLMLINSEKSGNRMEIKYQNVKNCCDKEFKNF